MIVEGESQFFIIMSGRGAPDGIECIVLYLRMEIFVA